MRIGINASFLRKPGTGIGQVTLNFLRNLGTLGQAQEYEYILYLEEDADISFLPKNFQKRVFLPFWKRDDVPRKWLWEKYALPQKAQEDACDVFLSLYQCATVLPSHIHHVMVVHDLIPRIFPEYQVNLRQKLYWRAVERAISQAEKIVTISESTGSDLREFGIEREKITIAYPGVNPVFDQVLTDEMKAFVWNKYELEPGYIYHGGGLEVRKNTEGVLRAYASMIKSPSTALRAEIPILVISGKIFDKTNTLATDVRGLVEELKLQNKVKLLGFVPDEDLPALYSGALFFVYPSLYEGFGLPVLEALSVHTPVVVSDNSSLLEVAGDAGVFITAENIQSIASGMERLLNDTALRQELREKSIIQARKFSWEDFSVKVFQALFNFQSK